MRIIKLTTQNQEEVIKTALAALKKGGLVVFPSDTVYGLLADAQNPTAVSKLLQFKEKWPGQAISVFVSNKAMAKDYVSLNQNGLNVVENLLPGPFTVIAESKHRTDPRLEAENGTLGIRLPNFPLILTLVAELRRPLTATSANLSGEPPHYSISSFLKSISKAKENRLDLVVDAGNLPKNKPSTVVDTTTGQLKPLRIGNLLPQTPNSFVSNSEEQTEELARFLAAKFIKKTPGKPIIFLLEGELGTGKTIFAKGLGKALGVKERVASPTFNICSEYSINFSAEMIGSDIENLYQNTTLNIKKPWKKFIHCDFYRIEAKEEFAELGFPNNIVSGNIYAFEWSERLPAEIISAVKNRAEIVHLQLRHAGKNKRVIKWGKN